MMHVLRTFCLLAAICTRICDAFSATYSVKTVGRRCLLLPGRSPSSESYCSTRQSVAGVYYSDGPPGKMMRSGGSRKCMQRKLRLFMSDNFPPYNLASSRPRLIWYQLVDSKTGQPYKSTTSSSVYLPSEFVIDQFRKAVQVENSSILTGITSSQLVVYKNKAAFDKRNGAEGKEVPLEVDSLISDLGVKKEEALFVAVPLPILAVLDRSLPCEIPFYTNMLRASEYGDWLSLDTNIPFTALNKVYIRECYKSIASSITSIIDNTVKKVIITGTPGIGKSLFMIYLLHKLVHEGKRVLFIYHPYNIYYDGHGGVFRFASGQLPLDADDLFWNETLWCLFDSKNKNEADLSAFPYELCNFIVSTSPRRDLINDFKKSPEPQVFYMPVWSEAELDAIASLFPHAHDWRDRFQILGGIPRRVGSQDTGSHGNTGSSMCRVLTR